jgi:holo-[acyl-carrier protein] synthase
MIIGIGCDMTNFNIAKKLNWESDEKLMSRVFSARELEIYYKQDKLTYLTGRFAAKEAVLKCLGTGMYDGISLNNIEILQLENGKPIIELSGEIKKISNDLGIKKWFVSISHSTKSSMAYVIAEG